MPAINSGSSNRNQVRAKPKPAPRRVASAPPRNADTGDTSRSRPAPAPQPTRAFQPPLKVARPFQAQQDQAQTSVRQSRRALPAPPLAEPPIITSPTGGGGKPSGEPMPRAQVISFLQSQHTASRAAREQIVGSIQRQVGNSHGQERVDRIAGLLDEVATDPRLARTRAAIRHYTAIEQQDARPQTTAELKPGPAPHHTSVGFATINTTAVGQAAAKVGAKLAPTLQINTPEVRFFKNAWSDVAHLPLMGPQASYEVAAASWEAAHGDVKRAKALAEGFTHGVYGSIARGDWTGLENYVRDHPVYAALEIRGGKGIVGRGLGAAMRSGALGDTARAAASTARGDINLAGETGARVADRQHYSPDVLTKAFQVGAEKVRGQGATVMRGHRLRRRADFESDMGAAASRTVRQDEGRQAEAAKPKGPLAEVVGLVVQGVVRPQSLKADLQKELTRLDGVVAHHESEVAAGRKGVFSTGAQKRQNRVTADAIREVLGNPAAMRRIADVAESGRANVRAINDLEGQAGRLGAITPDRAERAALFPAAQSHLGADYSDAPFRAARGREVAAARRLRAAQTTQRQARVTYARALSTAQRNLAEKRRTYLRRDEQYSTLEAEHGQAKYRKETLRAAVREAEATGKPVTVKYGDAEHTLTPPQARSLFEAAAGQQRSAASALAARARVLHEQPVVRTIKSGPNKGKRVPTAKASVKRAERRILAARAARDKPTLQTVPLARQAFDAARNERQAAQIGGTHSLNVAGQRITNQEIRAQAGLTEPVAYLPHHTQNRGAKAYYQTAFAGRKNLDSGGKRTGALHEKGAVDVSYDAVKEHRIRLRGVVNRIAEHDRIIHSISITGPKTPRNPHGMYTWDQAEKIASNASDRGAELVPYRAVPGSYDKARIDRIANAQGAADAPALAQMIGHEFEERLKAPAPGDRSTPNVVLIPKEMADQLKSQQGVFAAHGQLGNVAADVFRRTTLPFSVKWITGNIVEAGLRLGAVGAGVNAHRIGRNLLKELDTIDHDQALRVKAALTGGLLFGNRGLTVRRFHEHFQDTSLEKGAAAVSVAGQLPVVKQLGWLMKNYTDAVFNVNRVFETASQTAALGKYAKREMHEMTGSWAKATRAQQKALQDLARGFQDPKTIHDAARYIDQTLGQYSRFSPGMRRFVQTYTPFVPWYLNAVRFVFWTLPAKHPIKTGLMALAAQNLQADYDANHAGLPPGDLSTSIVADSGKVLPFGHYTPMGAFGSVLGGGNEQLTALVDPFFPQYKSAGLAAFGMNFSGHAAKIDPADRTSASVSGAVRASMMLNSLLEAFVPALATARHVREGGKTPWDNSTFLSPKTKPDTGVGTANRLLNPFRPVSGITGRPRGAATSTAVATPTRAPAATSTEDDLWNNLDQSQAGDSAAQQQLQDDLWNNLDGG